MLYCGKFFKKYFILEKDSFRAEPILWLYSILSIIFKTVVMVGFIYGKSHSTINWNSAKYAIPSFPLYIAFAVAIVSFSFLFKNRGKLWYFIIINAIFSIFVLGDAMNYRAFGSFISFHMLGQTSNLHNLSDSIVSMIHPIDIIFVIDILILIIIAFTFRDICRKSKRSIILFLLTLSLSVSYIYYEHYKYDVVEQGKNRIVFRICWAPIQTYSNLSTIGYHFYDGYQYFKDMLPSKLSESDEKEINSFLNNKDENLPDNEFAGVIKDKNLIIIQVESLENFVLNQKVNGKEITPNLNKLLKNSLYFSNYYEQVYNGTSSDAEFMTNTSIFPVRRGTTAFRFPNNSYNSLPKIMENQGYSTIALHGDKGSYWNWVNAFKSYGFDKCVEASNFKIDETIGLGLSDKSFFKQVEPILKEQKQPFYSFVITMTSHSPFDLPKEYRKLDLDESLNSTKLGGYFESMHYVDEQIGMFMDQLDKDGLLDNTAVVLYGDHCGVHKFYNQEVQQVKPAQDWWLVNDHKIPLIVYDKDISYKEIKTIGGQVDLMPTVCYLMGVDKKEYTYTSVGRNLLNTNKSFAVLADRTYIGDSKDKSEQEEDIKAIDISDKIIESNYFKSH